MFRIQLPASIVRAAAIDAAYVATATLQQAKRQARKQPLSAATHREVLAAQQVAKSLASHLRKVS